MAKCDNDYFSMLHLNIRSAVKNLDKFSSYIMGLNHVFPLIGLSETWFKDINKDCYGLDGYKAEHTCRTIRTGGGVSVYIKENIEYFRRTDLSTSNRVMESVFIELEKDQFGKKSNIIVGVIYRPPDTDINEFNELMLNTLSFIHLEKKSVYLMGDFNINLLNADKHVATQDFTDMMFSQSFLPHITKPTRITSRSATLIDNIFTNHLPQNEHVLTGILYNDVSDHLPVFYIDFCNVAQKMKTTFKKRIYSTENISKFKSALQETDWDEVMSMNDAQQAYSHFHNVYTELYDTNFPLKEFKIGYKTRKPWLSEGLKKQINIKNRLYRGGTKSNDPEHELLYKRFRNKVNSLIFKAEKDHYEQLLKNHQNDLKKSWKILKEVINKKKPSSSTSKFMINNQLSADKNKIANGFNNFFINVGPTLAKIITL